MHFPMRPFLTKWFMRLAAFAAGCALLTRPAYAGGTEIPNQGARAAGQAEAFGAQADDPTAIYYNPAGIGQLKGTQVSAGLYGIFPDFRFHAEGGGGESMTLTSVLPHFYVTSDLGTEKFHAGFGVFNEFGMNLDWGDKGPLRTIVNKSRLELLNFSPTISYNVTPNLTVAVAGNIYYSELVLERNAVLAPAPVPEGDFRVKGRDWAVGVTPAVFWKIDDRNTIGAWYRTPFTMDYPGHARLIDTGVTPQLSGTSKVAVDFPQIAGVAYAFRPIKPWKLETDIVYTDWATLHSIRLSSSNPAFNQNLPADWKSGFSFRAGTQYDLDEHWSLRAGYALGQRAMPGDTYTPLVPDSLYHLLTAGVGYQTRHWSLDAAYQFALRETRNISNSASSPTVDGTWENQIHTLMLTFTYRF